MKASPGAIRLEPLPTPFAPAEGSVCVATPTCCCCCCCLASVAATTSYSAAEAYYEAVENRRNRWLALTLALLGGVCTAVMIYGGIGTLDGGRDRMPAQMFVMGLLGAVILNFLALVVARHERPNAWTIIFAPVGALPLAFGELVIGMLLFMGGGLLLIDPVVAVVVSIYVVGLARERHLVRMGRPEGSEGGDPQESS